MKGRCLNPKNPAYKNYGGREIKVCERWLDYYNFWLDMGKKPTPKHTLGRIDPDGNYEPSNCRWETKVQQGHNSRTNKMTLEMAKRVRLYYRSGKYSQSELAKMCKVSAGIIWGIVRNKIWRETK